MRTKRLIPILGLWLAAAAAADGRAAGPGRPEAPTRGIGTEMSYRAREARVSEREAWARPGRPEAWTRGIGRDDSRAMRIGEMRACPPAAPGRPEGYTRGIHPQGRDPGRIRCAML